MHDRTISVVGVANMIPQPRMCSTFVYTFIVVGARRIHIVTSYILAGYICMIVWVLKCGRHCGLVVRANAYEAKVPGSNPTRGHFVFFFPFYYYMPYTKYKYHT